MDTLFPKANQKEIMRLSIQNYPKKFSVWVVFVVLWMALMIATPIILTRYGYPCLPYIITFTVILQSTASISILFLTKDQLIKKILFLFMIYISTFLIEFIGVKTGILFGIYAYSDLLKPLLFKVPIVIPLAWLMMLIPSWFTALFILNDKNKNSEFKFRINFSVLSAIIFTAWDLYLDPQMVSWGVWSWEYNGEYFGIPFQNFIGWFLSSSFITFILKPYNLLNKRDIGKGMSIYIITWIFQAIGLGYFWHQPLPALFGFLAMGSFIFYAFAVKLGKWKSFSGQ